MKHLGYSVYDSKAMAYTAPVFQPSEGLAFRAFEKAVTDHDSEWAKNPEDYSLWFVAEYDDSNGTVQECLPKSVYTGMEAVAAVLAKNKRLRALQDEISQLNSEDET